MAIRKPAEVFPPGAFLREELDERSWSPADLAEIIGRPPGLISDIINGKRGVSPETAKGLGAALGTSPEFWLSLEASYQLWRLRSDGDDAVARRARLYEKAPWREMVRRGWIEATENIDVLERRVLDFLDIQSLDEEPEFLLHAARKSKPYSGCTSEQLVWLIRARQISRTVQVREFSEDALETAVQKLRLLAHDLQEVRHVPRVLADAGVRLVVVQPLPRGQIDGATFWLDERSPVIALSMRYDRLDNFWFTLIHELKHVLSGEEAIDTDMEGGREDETKPESERAADEYSGEYFIQRAQLDNFIARIRPQYSARRIEAFAAIAQVHPAIVVGQLQHRGEVTWSSYRKLLVPVREIITATTVTDGWGSELPANL